MKLKGILTGILRGLIKPALTELGQRQRHEFRNGLHVELYVDTLRHIHLLLWRRAVDPHLNEWRTILRLLPADMPRPPAAVEPRRFKEGDRHCLTAQWLIVRPDPFSANTPEPTAEEQAV